MSKDRNNPPKDGADAQIMMAAVENALVQVGANAIDLLTVADRLVATCFANLAQNGYPQRQLQRYAHTVALRLLKTASDAANSKETLVPN